MTNIRINLNIFINKILKKINNPVAIVYNLGIGILLFPLAGQAFNCYLTAVKDSCWGNYDVTVSVSDANTNQMLISSIISKGSNWQRVPFTCNPGQTLNFQATFSPVFWQSDATTIFYIKQYKILPAVVSTGQTAWDISICFSKDFSEVPLPPEATGECSCDMSNIPPLSGS